MRVRKFGHSCLLVEERREALLFDPGREEFLSAAATPNAFASVALVAITHWHPDHADPDLIRRIVERSGARVLAPREGIEDLRKVGVEAAVPDAGSMEAGAFRLRLALVPHAAVLGGPAPGNYAYLVNDRLLNVGDSFDRGLDEFRGIAALALPVTAPWMTDLDAVAFAERLAPAKVLPVHDGYVKDFFRERRHAAYRDYLGRRGIGMEDAALDRGIEI